MRITLVVALWAIYTCHAATSGPRQKRTLRMLESLMDRMRETFGPEPAPAQRSLSPQPDVILTSKYPSLDVKYLYYPTVRMHIRPVQPVTKHIIYMKPVPAPSPLATPVIRSAVPLPNANVEIIRHIRPILRQPKTKTTTTITYQIIPLSLPLQSTPEALEHGDEESQIPWSIDALPPPMPTSKPTNAAEEHDVPWNLRALPPPVATKRPRVQIESEWYAEPMKPDISPAYLIPLAKKKLLIPAHTPNKLRYGYATHSTKPSRPSILQSEITVQPPVEVPSYTDIETVDHHSRRKYFNRLNDRRAQTFEDRKQRFRRDLQSSSPPWIEMVTKNFSENSMYPFRRTSFPIENEQRSLAEISSTTFSFPSSSDVYSFFTKSRPFLQPFGYDSGNEKLKNGESEMKSQKNGSHCSTEVNEKKKSKRQPFETQMSTVSGLSDPYANVSNNASIDFRGFVDKDKADKTPSAYNNGDEYKRSASGSNLTDSMVTVVRATNWLAEVTSIPDQYVAITPKPFNYVSGNIAANSSPKLEHAFNREWQMRTYPMLSQHFQNPKFVDDNDRRQRQLLRDPSTTFFHSSRSTFPFPDTGFLSKFPPTRNDYRDTVSDLFSTQKSGVKFAINREDDIQGLNYDNIEYFEPIVIDIDKENRGSEPDSKLKFNYKNWNNNNADRPLRLPDSLHETIDYLQKTLMHPPIFDLEGEAGELTMVAVMEGNEIT